MDKDQGTGKTSDVDASPLSPRTCWCEDRFGYLATKDLNCFYIVSVIPIYIISYSLSAMAICLHSNMFYDTLHICCHDNCLYLINVYIQLGSFVECMF